MESERELDDIMKVCRLCLGNSELISVFDEGLANPDSTKDILSFATGIQISRTDDISKMVCLACLKKAFESIETHAIHLKNTEELKKRRDILGVSHSVRSLITEYPTVVFPLQIKKCDMKPVVELDRNAITDWKEAIERERKSKEEEEAKVRTEPPAILKKNKSCENAAKRIKLSKKSTDDDFFKFFKLNMTRSIFVCDICNGILNNAKDLSRHKRTHMRCQLCKKTFQSLEETTEHVNKNCYMKKMMNQLPSIYLKRCEEDEELLKKYRKAFETKVPENYSDEITDRNSEFLVTDLDMELLLTSQCLSDVKENFDDVTLATFPASENNENFTIVTDTENNSHPVTPIKELALIENIEKCKATVVTETIIIDSDDEIQSTDRNDKSEAPNGMEFERLFRLAHKETANGLNTKKSQCVPKIQVLESGVMNVNLNDDDEEILRKVKASQKVYVNKHTLANSAPPDSSIESTPGKNVLFKMKNMMNYLKFTTIPINIYYSPNETLTFSNKKSRSLKDSKSNGKISTKPGKRQRSVLEELGEKSFRPHVENSRPTEKRKQISNDTSSDVLSMSIKPKIGPRKETVPTKVGNRKRKTVNSKSKGAKMNSLKVLEKNQNSGIKLLNNASGGEKTSPVNLKTASSTSSTTVPKASNTINPMSSSTTISTNNVNKGMTISIPESSSKQALQTVRRPEMSRGPVTSSTSSTTPNEPHLLNTMNPITSSTNKTINSKNVSRQKTPVTYTSTTSQNVSGGLATSDPAIYSTPFRITPNGHHLWHKMYPTTSSTITDAISENVHRGKTSVTCTSTTSQNVSRGPATSGPVTSSTSYSTTPNVPYLLNTMNPITSSTNTAVILKNDPRRKTPVTCTSTNYQNVSRGQATSGPVTSSTSYSTTPNVPYLLNTTNPITSSTNTAAILKNDPRGKTPVTCTSTNYQNVSGRPATSDPVTCSTSSRTLLNGPNLLNISSTNTTTISKNVSQGKTPVTFTSTASENVTNVPNSISNYNPIAPGKSIVTSSSGSLATALLVNNGQKSVPASILLLDSLLVSSGQKPQVTYANVISIQNSHPNQVFNEHNGSNRLKYDYQHNIPSNRKSGNLCNQPHLKSSTHDTISVLNNSLLSNGLYNNQYRMKHPRNSSTVINNNKFSIEKAIQHGYDQRQL